MRPGLNGNIDDKEWGVFFENIRGKAGWNLFFLVCNSYMADVAGNFTTFRAGVIQLRLILHNRFCIFTCTHPGDYLEHDKYLFINFKFVFYNYDA